MSPLNHLTFRNTSCRLAPACVGGETLQRLSFLSYSFVLLVGLCGFPHDYGVVGLPPSAIRYQLCPKQLLVPTYLEPPFVRYY